ncbi:MAG: DoxX family protein [Parcubacteria group bacterium]|nr:DoxX family protein [Parcubacteria group bacterium]
MVDFLSSLPSLNDYGLLAMRIAMGAIFLTHGIQKFGMWRMAPSAQMSASTINLMRLLSIVEPLGGIAILIGFLTQFAALGLGIIMIGAIAMKIKIWKKKFSESGGWEFDLILLAVAIALFFIGGGNFALDAFLF